MTCPNCGQHLVPQGGCYMCVNCGYSACDLRYARANTNARRPVLIDGDRIIAIYFGNLN